MGIATFDKLAPRRLKMSYENYLEFARDSQIVEWVGGAVITYMPPRYESDIPGIISDS